MSSFIEPSSSSPDSPPELLRESHEVQRRHETLSLDEDVSLTFASGCQHVAEDHSSRSFDVLNTALPLVATPDSSMDGLVLQQQKYQSGSPGHTPFPHRTNRFAYNDISGDGILGFSSPIPGRDGADLSSSADNPPVPYNSPDDSQLEEILKMEAKKQELQLQQRLGDQNLLDLFKTPERPDVIRSRKRLREALGDDASSSSEGVVMEELELLSKEDRITAYKDGDSLNDKESARRAKINSSLDLLRKIVPGMEDTMEKTEMYEMTAKYILFLKKKVGSKYDRDFLQEFLPY